MSEREPTPAIRQMLLEEDFRPNGDGRWCDAAGQREPLALEDAVRRAAKDRAGADWEAYARSLGWPDWRVDDIAERNAPERVVDVTADAIKICEATGSVLYYYREPGGACARRARSAERAAEERARATPDLPAFAPPPRARVVAAGDDAAPRPIVPVPWLDPLAGLEAWTDGSGNDQERPGGIGVVVAHAGDGAVVCCASDHLPFASNNFAEVTAIGRALRLVLHMTGARDAALRVWSDSAFALGAVAPWSTWRIRDDNAELAQLVAALRVETARWPRLALEHVAGHAKGYRRGSWARHPETGYNPVADELAGLARKRAPKGGAR